MTETVHKGQNQRRVRLVPSPIEKLRAQSDQSAWVNDALNNAQTTIYTEAELDIANLMNITNEDMQKILDEYWAGK